MPRTAAALLPVVLLGTLLGGAPAAPAAADESSVPPVTVVDAWDVTGTHTFPDEPSPLQAQRPSVVRAANGDLLASFNTTGDGHPGGQLRVIRSSDQGRTWGASHVVASPRLFGTAGSISVQRGMATMADGTILLPYNDMVNRSNYNSRESVLFIARSTDDGHTWLDTETPVPLPTPIREAHVAGSPIVTLADGTLLLGIWGATELVPDWQTSPAAWRSGVLRSFDGGRTWSDHRTIAHDPLNPPQYPPFHGSRYPSGANEFALQELPDGRVMAVIRYATGIGENRGQSYLSYSSDSGATWTPPVPMGAAMGSVGAEALSLTMSPCTNALDPASSALLLGHRVLNAAGQRIGQAAVRVSYDAGASWGSPATLRDAEGNTQLGAATGEPTFLRMDDRHVLVLFQDASSSPIRIVANLLQVPDAATCRAQSEAAAGIGDVTVFVERADREAWPWPLATTSRRVPATTTVAALLADVAPAVQCAPVRARLRDLRTGRVLEATRTLATAGVRNGAVLVLDDLARGPAWPRIGHNELDTAPTTRPLYGWNDVCDDDGLDLDRRGVSLGIDLGPSSPPLRSVSLVDSDATSRLAVRDGRPPYRVWASDDNRHFHEVFGWQFDSRVEDGRLVHRLTGLEVSARYLKITQPYTDTAATFHLGSLRRDVRLGFGPA